MVSSMEGGTWCARDISLRAQKKFLSRVGGTASARALVLDEHAAKLFDQSDGSTSRSQSPRAQPRDEPFPGQPWQDEPLKGPSTSSIVDVKQTIANDIIEPGHLEPLQFLTVLRERVEKREAEKLVKHVIKSAVKIGVLRRHGQLSAADERQLAAFRSKFHTVLMAVVSFCEVDFSYDRGFLQDALRESHQSLKSVVERHLSDKSVSRLAGVFSLASRGELLDSLFAGQVTEDVQKLARMLRKELDRGLL